MVTQEQLARRVPTATMVHTFPFCFTSRELTDPLLSAQGLARAVSARGTSATHARLVMMPTARLYSSAGQTRRVEALERALILPRSIRPTLTFSSLTVLARTGWRDLPFLTRVNNALLVSPGAFPCK